MFRLKQTALNVRTAVEANTIKNQGLSAL